MIQRNPQNTTQAKKPSHESTPPHPANTASADHLQACPLHVVPIQICAPHHGSAAPPPHIPMNRAHARPHRHQNYGIPCRQTRSHAPSKTPMPNEPTRSPQASTEKNHAHPVNPPPQAYADSPHPQPQMRRSHAAGAVPNRPRNPNYTKRPSRKSTPPAKPCAAPNFTKSPSRNSTTPANSCTARKHHGRLISNLDGRFY